MKIQQLKQQAAFMPLCLVALFLCCEFLLPSPTASAQDTTAAKPEAGDAAKTGDAATADDAAKKVADKPVLEGHSYHGEVFNEGPRQAAYLIDGVGTVRFPVTTSNDEARKFFEQGVAQLHGFWFFESERSFRQAATIDPDMAMAYWGMALSNKTNGDRAKGFIKEAMARKEKASPRERRYIEAFERYINAKSDSREDKERRAEKYIGDLEEIIHENPDDLEARAFLVDFFWTSRGDGVKTTSYFAIDSMIQDILDVEPLHPVHHYRIHLWDNEKPERALESAARGGLSAPAIAHMWHMPGHIYSRLKRYNDAVYQQEASARVDHAHMMRDRVMPDQIHNFAHNNEWCIRNMIHIGRVHDAVALSQNMMSMPMHPKYNHIEKFGSYRYGRQRLLEVLTTYELYAELLKLQAAGWLDPTGNEGEDLAADRATGAALAAVGRVAQAGEVRTRLQAALDDQNARQKEAGDAAQKKAAEEKKDEKESEKARKDAEEKFRSRINDLQHAIEEIDGRLAVTSGEFEKGLELLKKAGGVRVEQQIALMLRAGKTDDAVKRADEHVKANKNEVLPLACQVETLWTAGRKDEAKAAFEELRKLSSAIDADVPAFARLRPIAAELGITEDWIQPEVLAADIGARPALDSLGPLNWEPVSAPAWALLDIDGNTRSLSDYRGQPVIVIFYLGYGCLHCAEQLQKFAPKYDEFRKAGFEVIAVSTDKQQNLKRAFESLEKPFGFPLVADPEMAIFKQYRCFDDFEKVALHGTFIIDSKGLVRWQDISFEPFMDVDFVLKEGQRLLKLDGVRKDSQPTEVPLAEAAPR